MRSALSNEKRTVEGIHFLKVRGSLADRFRAHGKLLAEEIQQGPFPVLAKRNETLIRNTPSLPKIFQDLAVFSHDKILVNFLMSNLTAEEKDALHAFSESCGIPHSACQQALFQPETMMMLSRLSAMQSFLPGNLPGCTSCVALKNRTKSGELLVARNLDYPMVGPWEKNPVVVFNEPTGEIPYVYVSSAGLHTGGLTSINQEGITLCLHAHFGKNISLTGRPITLIGDEIIRKAKTIDQAIDMAKKSKRLANWAFVFSSAKENRAVVLQMTPDKMIVHSSEDDFLAHTNFFHTKELQSQEALFCGAYQDDLKTRFLRMTQLCKRMDLEPRNLMAALGDHVDILNGQQRVFGNTISVINTVCSIVMAPQSQHIWLSTRSESPTGLGNFLEVDLQNFWKNSDDTIPKKVISHSINPKLAEGVRWYRKAYQAYQMAPHNAETLSLTREFISKSIDAFPSDGHLYLQLGLICFRMEKFDEAETAFIQVRNCSENVLSVRDLYLARCYDLTGRRKKALQLYKRVCSVDKLQKAFEKGLRRPYNRKNANKTMIELQFPDTFIYN